MTPKPIDIDVGAQTREFSQGIDKGVIKPMKDVSKALDDVSKDGDDAGEKLTEGMRDAQKATEKLQDTIKDGSAQKKFATNTQESTSQAKTDLKELAGEAKQNAAETFSSFDGSAQSFVDGIQGTFGGIVSSLGPIGAAAGAAAAIGIGLFTAGLEKSKERAQKVREKVADLTDELIEAGGEGTISIDSITDSLKEMASATEEGEQSLADIAEQATDTGIPFRTLAKAMAGDPAALREAIRITEDQIAADRLLASTQEELTESQGQSANKYNERLLASQALLVQLQDETQVLTDARTAEQRYLSSGAAEYESKQALIDSINDAYDDAAESAGDFIDAETGLFNVDKYIKAMEKRSKSLKDYQDNLVKSGLSPAALSFLNEQGADTAAQMVQGYVDASPEQQKKLQAIWEKSAADASGVVDTKVSRVVNQSYDGPTITPKLDTRTFKNGLRELTTQQRTVKVNAELVTRDGRHIQ